MDGIRRRRLAILLIAALVGVVVLVFFSHRQETKTAAKSQPDEEQEAPPRSTVAAWDEPRATPHDDPPPAVPPGAHRDPPPVIDSITLEKQEVCAGEENLVTVKAHTVNGTDPDLHYVVDGQMGSSVPVRLFLDGTGDVAGKHTVSVFGRGNTAVTVALPSYEVKNCHPTRAAFVESRLRANTWGEFDFQAHVANMPAPPPPPDEKNPPPRPPPPKPFVADKYVWSFGDGDTMTTTSPIVSHDYEGRSQRALYSYFLVNVEARAKDGETVSGRYTLALINPAFEAFEAKGVVALMIALTPRFPELGSDGKVTQQVRIWHNQASPVTLERAQRTRYYQGGSGQTAPEEVDVGGVLGTTVIPPGKDGITVTVVLDVDREPEIATVTYEIAGHSAEGYPAMGSFSVMQPPPKPTASNSTPVSNAMMKAKILLARELLHRDVVNDEDLWALERQGMFANLKPATLSAAELTSAAQLPPRGAPGDPGAPVPRTGSDQLAAPAPEPPQETASGSK